MKDVLSALATNLHIVVISLLIVGLDLGMVRIGNHTRTGQPPAAVTLSTSSDSDGGHSGDRGDSAGSKQSASTPTGSAASMVLPGGRPAEEWKPPGRRLVKGL
jgi:hypothetical protein